MDENRVPPIKRWPNRPRLKGFAYDGGHAYHIVFNTAEHRPLLGGELADAVVESLVGAAAATSFDLLVYTVMPDHVHSLIQALDPDASPVKFVQRCKQRPGHAYRRNTRQHLWLPSFYDRVVRRGDDAREIAAYILDNPVRAGLMQEGDVWPHSGGTLVERSIPQG
ncbi:MAG: hypothetical protein EPO22_10555 [Dehalococcoidia bacterium]|nr:MAG: hypothetical protein EPO22_10555 [Dehalococcoidia bacterium]